MPLTARFVPGQLVQSIAGRDSGKYFLVMGTGVDSGMVQVADGSVRRVNCPKKKNIKHLKRFGLIDGDLAEKVRLNQRVTNGEVEKAIKNLMAGLEG